MKDYLKEKILSVLIKLGFNKYPVIIEKSRDIKFGDYSTNIAMVISKQEKKNPREIAAQIISILSLPDGYIIKAEIAGAGFINFFISNEYYLNEIINILSCGSNFGKLNINKDKTADIEWVSANPTGPLHAGHGRHIAIGKAIANLLEWSGYNVTREYYFNNAGKQMDNLANSIFARYKQIYEADFPFSGKWVCWRLY